MLSGTKAAGRAKIELLEMAIRLKASLPRGRKYKAGKDKDGWGAAVWKAKGKREQVSLKRWNKCEKNIVRQIWEGLSPGKQGFLYMFG